MTWSAASDLTRLTFLVLHTAVTSAPKYLASWTAAVPMEPDAPYTRIVFPSRSSAGLRQPRARIAPSQTAAASSKLMPAGLRASAARSRMQANCACAPNRHALTPKTWSPAVNSVTAGPAASTSPASSVPRIFHLGRGKPLMNRLKYGSPWRIAVSVRLTVVARTLMRTSSCLGTGRATSASRRTSGGPYLSKTTALMSSPSLGRPNSCPNSETARRRAGSRRPSVTRPRAGQRGSN